MLLKVINLESVCPVMCGTNVTSHGKTYTNVLTFNGLKRQLAVSHRQSAVSNPIVNVRRFHQTVRRIHQTVRRFQQTVSSMEKALVVTL